MIGESKYSGLLPALDNPRNDARAMDDLLGDLGFEVTRVLDGDRDKLEDEIADFVTAARSADVALVYYSGHGIEADGKNYMVPTDTDLSTPETAGRTLIPVDDLLGQLAKAVPVTIMLLDACRTSNFPAGTMIQPPGAPAPVPATEDGLALVRGPDPVAKPGVPVSSLGMIIGFAASPGRPALDGPPGENSPYAAALLKHLSAGGYSFGDMMTMVSEEVYLKTASRQRPWVNTSLLRVLTFGKPIEDTDPDETAIRDGRRQLLLTISTETPATRTAVEGIAGAEGVPLDALYGMLKQLSVDISGGKGDLESQLREGARQLKLFKEQQLGTASSDPELKRLADLATRAQDEGAMKLALSYREQATARAEVLKGERDQLEAGLKADRLEIGATFASHAQLAALNFDYKKSAEMWGRAYDEVARWDDDLALTYKWSQAGALRDDGDFRADNSSLEQSFVAYEDAAKLVPKDTKPGVWAAIESDYGWALYTLGERNSDPARLQQAIDVLEPAVAEAPPGTPPDQLAISQMNLANAMSALGQRESDGKRLAAAANLFETVLSGLPRETYGYVWGKLEFNFGTTLTAIGDREKGPQSLIRAMAALESSIEEITQASYPLEWAQAENNYGVALYALGVRENDAGLLNRAVAAFKLALKERREDNVPLDWATTQSNLANVYVQLSALGGGDEDLLNQALDMYRGGFRHLTRDTAPQQWATEQFNIGSVLTALSRVTRDPRPLYDAIDAFGLALEERTEARDPQNWALTQLSLSQALTQLGSDDSLLQAADGAINTRHLRDAIDAASAALRQWTRQTQPLFWARARSAVGSAYQSLGDSEKGRNSYLAAANAYADALDEFDTVSSAPDWLRATKNYALTLESIGIRGGGTAYVNQAITQYLNTFAVVSVTNNPMEFGRVNFELFYCYQLLDDNGVAGQLPKAVDALRTALTGYDRENSPNEWATVQFNLGNVLYTMSERENGVPEDLSQAIDAYVAAQQVKTRASDPFIWAQAENFIGMAYGAWGKLVGERALVQTGRDHLAAAWEVYKSRDHDYDADFASRLADLDQAIANMS